MGEGDKVVAGKGEDGSAAGLDARDGDEVHDGEAAEGEEDGWGAAHGVEEELGNRWPLGLLTRSRGSPMQSTKTRLKTNPMI